MNQMKKITHTNNQCGRRIGSGAFPMRTSHSRSDTKSADDRGISGSIDGQRDSLGASMPPWDGDALMVMSGGGG